MSNELTVTPATIAGQMESADTMLSKVNELTADEVKTLRRILRTAAGNVRLLFELRADPDTGEFKLENYGQAWMLADLLKAGQMVPSSYKTDEQVVIGLMKAMEIGVSPISGLANIMIVNNRPSVWGDLAQALVQRTGVWEKHEFEELNGPMPGPEVGLDKWPNDYGWRVRIWRKGNPTPFEGVYTVGQAKRANLWMNTKKQPWITDPARMIFNRARAFAIRDGFADKLMGMGIIEEQMDFEPGQPSPLIAHNVTPAIPSLADDEPETEEQSAPDYSERQAPAAAGPDAPLDMDDAGQPVDLPIEEVERLKGEGKDPTLI